MATPPSSVEEIGIIAESARGQARTLAIVFVAINVLLPVGLYFYAGYKQKEYWDLFQGERTSANWLSSVQCILIGLIAWANHLAERTARRFAVGERARYPWIWAVFAAGFVFLALDERFQVHEAIRDRFFRPFALFTDIPGLSPGDVGLYFFLAAGVVFSFFLLDELRRRPPSLLLFAGALVLSTVVVVLDSVDRDVIQTWSDPYFWDYTAEELGELWAQVLFMLAFLRVLHGRLAEIGAATESAPEGDGG